MKLPPVYLITPPKLNGPGLQKWTSVLFDLGCTLIQHRRKGLPDAVQLRELEGILSRSQGYGAAILVDDRCDLCLIAGAHGVHLGQEDLPPALARALLGPDAVIGLSTHSIAQAEAAQGEPVDYFALGPVFETASKEKPDAVVGEEEQRAVLALASVPVVAIGGVTPERAPLLWARGFASVASISAFEEDPARALGAFLAKAPRAQGGT